MRRMAAVRVGIRVAAALAAFGAAAAPAEVRGQEEGPAPRKPLENPVPAELDTLADEMTAEVESFRALRFRTVVSRRMRPRAAVVEEFRPRTKKKGKGPSGETRALRFLGLLEGKAPAAGAGGKAKPVDDVPDAAETEARFRAESVGGYYSARDKVFTLVEGDGGSLNRMIVFHELIHALEDQHYDFRAFEKPLHATDRADRLRAYRALVEGSAQYHTDRWIDAEPGRRSKVFAEIMVRGAAELAADGKGAAGPEPEKAPEGLEPDVETGEKKDEGDGGGGEDEAPDDVARAPGGEKSLEDAPVYLVIREVMFPYHNGKLFLEQVLPALPPAPEGADPLARLFAEPPASTEQVLHPEKYFGAPDLPREVVLPDLASVLGEGWTKSTEETLGELGLGIAVNRWIYPKAMPVQLSAVLRPPAGGFTKPEDLMNTPVVFRGTSGTVTQGWDGDRLAIWSNGDRDCLAWVLVFDSDADAAEFVQGYAKVLKHKYKGAPQGSDGVWTGTGGGSTAVVAHGDRAVVAERVPPEVLGRVVEALRAAAVERDPRDTVPALPK